MAIVRVVPGTQVNQDGTYPEWRGGRKGTAMVQDAAGRYEEAAYRGAIFSATQTAGAAAIALAAGGATLVVYNPSTSRVNLSILDVAVALEAETNATQQCAVLLGGAAMGSTQTITTPLVPQSTLVGSSVQSNGKAAVSTTFSNAAVGLFVLGAFGQSANATAVGTPTVTSLKYEIAGAIIVPPGSYVGIYVVSGGTLTDLTFLSSIIWEEIPL